MLLGALLGLGTSSARAEMVVPVEGPWTGITSVGLPVHFGVEGDDVVDVRFGFNWGYCGAYESDLLPNSAPIDTDGHWSFDDPRGQSIEGAFAASDRVEGKVSTVERELPSCPATHATFFAVPGTAQPPAPPQVYAVQNANNGHQSRTPAEIIIGKGISFYLYGLTWHGYGGSVARATGRANIQRFKREWHPRAAVRLSSLVDDGPGRRLYSVLRYSLAGRLPAHFPRHGELRFRGQQR